MFKVDFNRGRMLGLTGSILALLSLILVFPLAIDFLVRSSFIMNEDIYFDIFRLTPIVISGFFSQTLGLSLVLISLYVFSKVYEERVIFRYALFSVIIGYGVPIATSTILYHLSPSLLPYYRYDTWARLILGLRLSTPLTIIALIISAYLWYRALKAFTLKSGERFFKQAGLLYLGFALSYTLGGLAFLGGLILLVLSTFASPIGIVFSILGVILVFLISGLIAVPGVLLCLVSWIILAIAFYKLKPLQPLHLRGSPSV